MISIFNKSILVFIGLAILSSAGRAQQSTDQQLQECMNKQMTQGAAVGAIAGALLGGFLSKKNDKGAGLALGAGLGAAAGGAIAWQKSWKSCTESLNIVTLKNIQTEDYKKTADRLGYSGNGVLVKLESLTVSPKVIAGNKLDAGLKFVVLKPDPSQDTQVQITRSWVCGSSQISIKPEVVTVAQGTVSQEGKVQIPSAKPEVGEQQCEMNIKVEAEGQSFEEKRPFTIIPG